MGQMSWRVTGSTSLPAEKLGFRAQEFKFKGCKVFFSLGPVLGARINEVIGLQKSQPHTSIAETNIADLLEGTNTMISRQDIKGLYRDIGKPLCNPISRPFPMCFPCGRRQNLEASLRSS